MFSVTIPCKPYVRHYLIMRFGSPVNLTCEPYLNNIFRRLLRKPSTRHDKYYNDLLKSPNTYYSCNIEVGVSESDFYRYGWELTKTDIIAFNSEIETRVKKLMRDVVEIYENVMLQKEAILRFQEEFGFSEEIWPYESIKKDYYRSVVPNRPSLRMEIQNQIQRYIDNKIEIIYGNIVPPKDNIADNAKTP